MCSPDNLQPSPMQCPSSAQARYPRICDSTPHRPGHPSAGLSPAGSNAQEIEMTAIATARVPKDSLLKLALTAFGVIFLFIYPMGLIWPSGWVWHGGHGEYYLQMICGIYAVLGVFLILAARNPSEHRSLISFTI